MIPPSINERADIAIFRAGIEPRRSSQASTYAVGAAGRDDGIVLVADDGQDDKEPHVAGEGTSVKPVD